MSLRLIFLGLLLSTQVNAGPISSGGDDAIQNAHFLCHSKKDITGQSRYTIMVSARDSYTDSLPIYLADSSTKKMLEIDITSKVVFNHDHMELVYASEGESNDEFRMSINLTPLGSGSQATQFAASLTHKNSDNELEDVEFICIR